LQENPRLARWVGKQRKLYKAKQNGGFYTLDDQKEKRLKELDFCFE
jgi:hypothetical protein